MKFSKSGTSKTATLLLLVGMSLASVEAALIGFFPFDDPANPTKDESVPAPGLPLQSVDPAADPVYSATGGLGGSGAFVFDGTQRLVTAFEIDPTAYPWLTMGAWVKASSLAPGLRKFIGHDNGGWDRAIGLDTRQNGIFGYATFTGGGVLNSERAPASEDDWAFVAATYDQDAQQVSLYVDPDVSTGGPLIARTTAGSFGPGHPQAAIGGLDPTSAAEAWLGTIDNVFFFDEVLTEAQLTDIRDRGKNAILGIPGGDDPNLVLANAPDLSVLQRLPEIRTFAFVLSNSGSSQVLNISSVSVVGPDAGHFTIENFPATIAPGASGTLNLQFNNGGQVGQFLAQLLIVSDDQSTTNFVIDISPRVISPALLGFYSFDDAAEPFKDDSGASRHLTGAVEPVHVPEGGIEGGAVVFDGSQRLAAPIDINPGPVPNLTMGAWVRTDVLDGLHKIMGHDNGGWDRTLGLDNRGTDDASTHYTAFAGRGAYPLTDPPAMPDNSEAWSFVAVVYAGPQNLVTTYIDLDVASTEDPLLTGTTTTTMGEGTPTVGIGGIAPTGTGEPWIGSIDNAFFINGALDAEQMELLRAGGKNYLLGLTPDPIFSGPAQPVFGDLPTTGVFTTNVPISNMGATQPLRISRAVVTGPDAGLFSLGAIPSEIAPGAVASIPVTLTSSDRVGGVNARLEVYSNNAGNRLSTVSLAAYLPFPSARAALIGFYPFDDAEAPLTDASGKGANASLSSEIEPFYDPTGGFSGGAYVFEGEQRLSAPININPSVYPKLTMGAWVRPSTLDPLNSKIMGHDDGGWDRTIGLDVRGTEELTTHHYTAFAGRNAYPLTDPPATPVNTEDWTFIAAVYDQLANTVTTYIDLDAATTNDALQTAVTTTTIGSGSTILGIGAISATTGEFWWGAIDNVFVYGTGLSAEQITAIRDGGADAILAGDIPPDSLRITDVQFDTGLSITWESVAGQTYQVQYTETVAGPWTDIATVSATGSSTVYTDSDATRLARGTGFYRIFQP